MINIGEIVKYKGIKKTTSITSSDMFKWLTENRRYCILDIKIYLGETYYLINHDEDITLWYPEENFEYLPRLKPYKPCKSMRCKYNLI